VNELSDKELIEMLASGNQSDCTKVLIFLKHEMAVKVHRLIKRMGGRKEDAEEALNEGLLVAWQHAKQNRFKPDSNVRGFIYTVAHHYYYGQSNNRSNIPTVSLDEFVKEIPENVEDLEGFNIQSEILKRAMRLLSSDCQRVLIAFYFEHKIKIWITRI